MKMHVRVERAAETLNRGDGTGATVNDAASARAAALERERTAASIRQPIRDGICADRA
ncbi:MAG TPA: hypothetical protein VGK30_08240 [Candidatus Binatia bacterium]|jgi:hypothetical protein